MGKGKNITIPWWKKWLSYVTELHQESTSSPYNPHLHVSIANGRYQLCTENAIYSHEDKYDNFTKTFEKLDWQKLHPDKTLVLGLGLGSVPQLLEKFDIKTEITSVEIDEEVIYLMSKYILPKLKNPIYTIEADAHTFMSINEEKFDLICMDVFVSDKIPQKFQSIDFLKSLGNALTKEGLLIYNQLGSTEEDRKLAQDFFDEKFRSVFPKAKLLPIIGNYMLLSNSIFLK